MVGGHARRRRRTQLHRSERARDRWGAEAAPGALRLPIVGVGGIMSADDACRILDAGATLVQLYSGFIYKGPDLVKAVAQGARPARAHAAR